MWKMLIMAFIATPALAAGECPALLNHQFQTLQGKSLNLCDYQDKPILVVNTASKCGFTPQFEKLENLYQKYQAQGFLVVGFPSNDFRQELNDNKEIGSFCKLTYGVKFPMVSKGAVTGANANPLYKQLAEATGKQPQWNFYKYVISPNAKSVAVFESSVEPDAPEIMQLITSGLNTKSNK